MIRVMIADDHAVMRDGVRHILERAGNFEVVCEASDGTQVIQLVREHSPQVVVLDLSMPGRSGLDLVRQLHADHPSVRVLVLTMHAEEQYVARAFRAGAAAYLTKESAATELVAALTKVAQGGTYVSPAHTKLSDREMEVYRRLVRGEPLTEIASSLCVSAKTVSTYKMRLMTKLQLPSEAALVRYAIRNQLFPDDDAL
jgi:DNA-binding NarL/FixJ family response regulator